jgi:hypothetical protein
MSYNPCIDHESCSGIKNSLCLCAFICLRAFSANDITSHARIHDYKFLVFFYGRIQHMAEILNDIGCTMTVHSGVTVMLCICIVEFLCSNLAQYTGYLIWGISWFSSGSSSKFPDSIRLDQKRFLSNTFQSSVILPSYAIESVLIRA